MSDAILSPTLMQNEEVFQESVKLYLGGHNHDSGMSRNLKHPNVAVYLRVSSDDQSIDAQKRKLTTYLNVEGFDIDECQVFVDEGVSARDNSFIDRPAGEEMVKAIKRGEITHVYGTYVNRFFRDVAEGSTWIKHMAKNHPQCIIKTTDCFAGHLLPEARMIWHTLLMIAEMENEQRAIRTKSGMQLKQERCEKTSSNIFGWEEYDTGRRNYTNGKDVGALIKVRPCWHEIAVKEWIESELANQSANKIANKLNGWGIPNASGGKWSPSSVRAIKSRPPKQHDQLHQFDAVRPKRLIQAPFRTFKPAQRSSKNGNGILVWRNGDGSE